MTACVFRLPAGATEIVVDSSCSLVDALTAANADAPVGDCPAGSGADEIRLTADVTLVAVHNYDAGPNGLPIITSPVTIDGEGFVIARGSSSPRFRIFRVGARGHLTLRRIVVRGGEATAIGGSIASHGELSLYETTIRDNVVSSGGGVLRGGGIYTTGRTSITRCKILSNRVDAFAGSAWGGGVFSATELTVADSLIEGNGASGELSSSGGGVGGSGIVTVARSTLHLNTATAGILTSRGGAVSGLAGSNLTIINSTVAANSADEGAAVAGAGSIVHTTFHGNRSGVAIFGHGVGFILSGSVLAASGGDHCGGKILDGGGNLADDLTCPPVAGTLTGVDPTLADNGGPTRTHALLAGSSAVDNAPDCGPDTDQRGAGRSAPCDSGSFELIDGTPPES